MTHTRGHRARRRSTRRRGGDDPGISRAQRVARLGAPSVRDASIKLVPGEVRDTPSPQSLFNKPSDYDPYAGVTDTGFENVKHSPQAVAVFQAQLEKIEQQINKKKEQIDARNTTLGERGTRGEGDFLRKMHRDQLAVLEKKADDIRGQISKGQKAGRRSKTLRKMPRGLVVQRICAVVIRPVGMKKTLGTRRRR